ncbi:hypothetical protein WA026_003594 [Henosepilachna vigintioctopunctata]|uniref:Uncharacterized protein n=1 Tax=Henosepilachna vigintioctopunctata TaxID=420089 RepID=A0AAW1TNX9_9CUCU
MYCIISELGEMMKALGINRALTPEIGPPLDSDLLSTRVVHSSRHGDLLFLLCLLIAQVRALFIVPKAPTEINSQFEPEVSNSSSQGHLISSKVTSPVQLELSESSMQDFSMALMAADKVIQQPEVSYFFSKGELIFPSKVF